MSEYPKELVRVRHLFDGTEVTIRPIRAEDAAMELAFVNRLSEESRYARFMEYMRDLPQSKLKYLTDVDYDRHLALVATVQQDGAELEIGVARYVVDPHQNGSCEFAIAVDDDRQGSGVAGVLMAALMDAARARGLRTMEGFVLSSNHRMLKFAHQLGFSTHRELGDGGTVRIERAL